jgi:hypothetical protein
MNDTGHPIWVLLFVIGLVPLSLVVELIVAVFSKRVRGYIVSHPVAHFVLFGFAVLCVLLLIPAHSTSHGGY